MCVCCERWAEEVFETLINEWELRQEELSAEPMAAAYLDAAITDLKDALEVFRGGMPKEVGDGFHLVVAGSDASSN